MPRHLAIVPAYNERGAIGATVADLREHAPDFDVLVVDDGSTDDTARIARSGRARRCSTLPFNLGIGGAVQAGYMYALERGYDVAVQVDGDGQHDARQIHELLAHLHANPELGMVTGSRFLAADDGYRSSAHRRAGHQHLRVGALAHRRPPGDRPDVGLPDGRRGAASSCSRATTRTTTPRSRRSCCCTSTSSRAPSYRCACARGPTGVSSINASRSVYYMIKVLLAIFVGLLRARPVVEPGDPAPVTAEQSL